MKRLLTLGVLPLALGLSASVAVADMEGQRVPPKGTEGPDISAKMEARGLWVTYPPVPRGVEGPDLR